MSKTYFLIFFVFSLQTLTFSSTSDRVGYTLPIYGPSYDLGRGGKEGREGGAVDKFREFG